MCECDAPTISRTTRRKARVQHACLECRAPIKPGERYVENAQLFDGHWATWKVCLACDALYAEYHDLTDCCAQVGYLATDIADFADACGKLADVPEGMVAFAERRGDAWPSQMREDA